MEFTKNKKLSLIAILIIIAMYNAVVFVLPFSKGAGFWVGYGFSMLALLLTVGVGVFAFNRDGFKSKYYGIPLISVAWRYLTIQLVVGLLEMILQLIPFQYGFVLNIILLGACLIGLISVNVGKEEIERIDEKVKEKVFYIKSLQVEVENIIDKITDESAKKALKDFAEAIRFSDAMSNPQLSAIENKLEVKVSALGETTGVGEIKALCDELQQLLAERNRKCKILK